MIFLVLFCLLLLLSIFTASWRLSLACLGLQAIGMGCYLLDVTHGGGGLQYGVTVMELILVKGIVVPWFLAMQFRRNQVPRFIDLIPANLLHWTMAAFFVALAYLAAAELERESVMLVGAALSAVALGMLVLSSQNQLPGQIIAMLTIENGVSLFVSSSSHETPWVLELLVTFDFIGLVVLTGCFLTFLPTHLKPSNDERVLASSSAIPPQLRGSLSSEDYGDVL